MIEFYITKYGVNVLCIKNTHYMYFTNGAMFYTQPAYNYKKVKYMTTTHGPITIKQIYELLYGRG